MAAVAPFLADTSGPFSQLLATEHTAQTVQAWIQERKDVIRTIKRQAIDQDTAYEAIYDHIKQLEGDIVGFKRLLQSNEASRDHWRRVHMGIWRGTVRPMKVIDLPREILTMIFSNLQEVRVANIKGPRISRNGGLPSPDVSNIQSIRLTCRAFCDSGSRFLIPVVDVKFTRASLQQLDEISRHPSFSKGVFVLRLHGNPYNSLIANDRNRFLEATEDRLSYLRFRFKSETTHTQQEMAESCRVVGIASEHEFLESHRINVQLAETETDRLTKTLRKLTWEPQLEGPFYFSEDNIITAIDEACEGYQRSYVEEQALISDHQVFVRIAACVRQMPCLQKVCIPDAGMSTWEGIFRTGWDQRFDAQKYVASITSTNPFWGLMVNDCDGEDSIVRWDGDRPQPLLRELPFVLQAANENLTHLDITLPSLRSHQVEPLETYLANIRHSCQNLKNVQVTVIETPSTVEPNDRGSVVTTCTILSAILVSPGLEVATLSYRNRSYTYHCLDCKTSIGAVLTKRSWDNLRSLYIQGFALAVPELQLLLEKVPGKIHLELDSVCLRKGTWRKALDILRGKVGSSSRVTNPLSVRLRRLWRTKEFRYFRQEFHSEHRDGWYSDLRCPGPASFYIRGGNVPNPLVRVED